MTPEAALTELLARLGANNGAPVMVNDEELGEWPAAAIAAMKAHKLLVKARSAASVVCPGCEQQCVMPVHTPSGPRVPVSFVVCDKRDDISRVLVDPARLTQWRCDGKAVCTFVAESLGLRQRDYEPAEGLLTIGMATGKKRRQMVCLRPAGEPTLVVASIATPLAELIEYHTGAYRVDNEAVGALVDSATTADPRHTPTNARREARKLDTQAMYGQWQKAYRVLKKQRHMSDVWYSKQIAKQDIALGRDAETIRKHMKK